MEASRDSSGLKELNSAAKGMGEVVAAAILLKPYRARMLMERTGIRWFTGVTPVDGLPFILALNAASRKKGTKMKLPLLAQQGQLRMRHKSMLERMLAASAS